MYVKIGGSMKKNSENFKKLIDNVLMKVRGIDIKKFYPREIIKWEKEKKKKYSVIALVIPIALVIVITSVVHLNKVKSMKITTNKAEEYFYKNQYDQSIAEYVKLDKNQDWPYWKIKKAEVYSVSGNIEESNKILNQSIQQREQYITDKKQNGEDFKVKDEELTNYIVFTEFMNKNFELALKYGEEYLKIYPKNKKLIKTMFTVYMANGQKEKATNLIATYPVDNTAYDLAVYARMNMLLDKWDEGFQILENAWNADKDEYKVYDVISQIAAYNKNSFIEKIYNLSEKNKDNLAYKIWMAKIYSMEEDSSEEAMKILSEVEDKHIGKFAVELIKASVLKNSSKTEEADKLLNEIIEKNKDDYRVYHTVAWHYYDKKDYNKALEYCNKSILKNKDYPDNYGFLMPEIMKAMNKSNEAEPYFRTALLKEPFNYNIMLSIANYYWYTTENSGKALEYFNLASLVRPTDSEILYNMALIKLKQDKIDETVELLKKCISIDAVIPKYHRTLGTIYLQNNKMELAIKEIRYAYDADKNDILTLNNAGCYYISVEGEVERGMLNLKGAYTSLNDSVDDYTKKTITENYEKAKKLYDEYIKEEGTSLKVPDFVLFY